MIKKVVAAAAATSGLLLAGAGMAVADSGAQGASVNSPGVLSGNTVQAPIHVPVNVCGNTINVIGLLNPAFGNTCVND
ncbi:chaplin ChpH [Streptomyces sp. NPDC054796]